MNEQLVTYGAIAAGALLLVLIFAVSVGLKRRPKKLNKAYYQEEWKKLQTKLSKEDLWPLAIIEADKLLDHALKRSKYKGKTMGERLVSAQRDLSRNDAVWFAHKLRNRIVHEETGQLRERDVKAALIGLRDALKDLGAL